MVGAGSVSRNVNLHRARMGTSTANKPSMLAKLLWWSLCFIACCLIALSLFGVWALGGLQQSGFPTAHPTALVSSRWPLLFMLAGSVMTTLAVLTSPLSSLRTRQQKLFVLISFGILLTIACQSCDRLADGQPLKIRM
jgi:hypothetical protein